MGTGHAFWAEADRGNFGSLLRGMDYCSAARSGSVWEPVETRKVVGKQVGGRKGVGRGLGGLGEVRGVRKGFGRPWESAEEAGKAREVTVRYNYTNREYGEMWTSDWWWNMQVCCEVG